MVLSLVRAELDKEEEPEKKETPNSKIFWREDFCLPKWRILFFFLNRVAVQCNNSVEQAILNSYSEQIKHLPG